MSNTRDFDKDRVIKLSSPLPSEQNHSDRTSFMDMANKAMIAGDYAEAERIYRLEIESLEKQLGADHFELALVMHSLALVLEIQQRYAEAESLRERTSEILLLHQRTQQENQTG